MTHTPSTCPACNAPLGDHLRGVVEVDDIEGVDPESWSAGARIAFTVMLASIAAMLVVLAKLAGWL